MRRAHVRILGGNKRFISRPWEGLGEVNTSAVGGCRIEGYYDMLWCLCKPHPISYTLFIRVVLNYRRTVALKNVYVRRRVHHTNCLSLNECRLRSPPLLPPFDVRQRGGHDDRGGGLRVRRPPLPHRHRDQVRAATAVSGRGRGRLVGGRRGLRRGLHAQRRHYRVLRGAGA